MRGDRWLKFYQWLKLWAERKEHAAYMRLHLCDLQCPQCKTWGGNSPNQCWEGMRPGTTDGHDQFKCGKCGYWSNWDGRGMFKMLDDPNFPKSDDGAIPKGAASGLSSLLSEPPKQDGV